MKNGSKLWFLEIHCESLRMAFDQSNQIMYISDLKPEIIEINLNTKSVKELYKKPISNRCNYGPDFVQLFHIKDKLHIVDNEDFIH